MSDRFLGCLIFLVSEFSVQTVWAKEGLAVPPPTTEASGTEDSAQSGIRGEDHKHEPYFGPIARRLQEITPSDDSRFHFPQTRFNLDQALQVPDWIHLGLDFRTRYESYSQLVKKHETTGAAQFSERTDIVEARYKPFKFHLEFLDTRPLYNYGIAVSNRMENQNDVLQLYGSVGTDNFLGSGLPTELQIGKFTQDFGRRRLIARSGYNNVPHSFVRAH